MKYLFIQKHEKSTKFIFWKLYIEKYIWKLYVEKNSLINIDSTVIYMSTKTECKEAANS